MQGLYRRNGSMTFAHASEYDGHFDAFIVKMHGSLEKGFAPMIQKCCVFAGRSLTDQVSPFPLFKSTLPKGNSL